MSPVARRAVLAVLALVTLGLAALGLRAARTSPPPTAAPPAPEPPRVPIVLDVLDVEEVRTSWIRRAGSAPSPAELDALIRGAVDEEILFQEALRLGLLQSDPIVKRRLAQNVQFVTGQGEVDWQAVQDALDLGFGKDDPMIRRRLVQTMERLLRFRARSEAPEDAELEEHLREKADTFRTPTRARFTQVFLDPRKRDADERARVAARVRDLEPADALALADPFLLPREMGPASESEIGKRFGTTFAQTVIELPAGAWSDPVPSSYGEHVVFVHEVIPATLPPLDAIRARVTSSWLRIREDEEVRKGLDELRSHYEIRVERPVETPPRDVDDAGEAGLR